MKKIIALFAALVLLAASCALAETSLPAAMPEIDPANFEKYASFAMDESTGAWSVRSIEADAALERFAANASSYTNLACFTLELNGSARTGLVVPTLAVYSNRASFDAISIRIGDARHDFTGVSTEVAAGGVACRKLAMPMDAEDLETLRALSDADSAVVRLHGDNVYTLKLTRKERYSNAKEQIETSSLAGMRTMLDAVDWSKYDLWDLNEAVWIAQTGVRPQRQTVQLGSAEGDVRLSADLEMLSRGESGSSVIALQKLLVSAGFLQTVGDSSFGRSVQQAVRRAQQFYGLPVTGSADRTLIDCLTGAAVPAEAEDAEWSGEVLGETAELSLDRWWFAPSVQTAKGGSERSAMNSDNLLWIADGRIRCLSAEELDLYRNISGKLICDGKYEYAAAIVCESDGGAQFASSLLPLEEARLVVYAEVPAAARRAPHEWTLRLQIGEIELTFSVDAE